MAFSVILEEIVKKIFDHYIIYAPTEFRNHFFFVFKFLDL